MIAFDIQPAKTVEAIYIKADGSVNLPTAPIQTDEIMLFRKCGELKAKESFHKIKK